MAFAMVPLVRRCETVKAARNLGGGSRRHAVAAGAAQHRDGVDPVPHGLRRVTLVRVEIRSDGLREGVRVGGPGADGLVDVALLPDAAEEPARLEPLVRSEEILQQRK